MKDKQINGKNLENDPIALYIINSINFTGGWIYISPQAALGFNELLWMLS